MLLFAVKKEYFLKFIFRQETCVISLKSKYNNLYIPSDFFHVSFSWVENFPLTRPFTLGQPCNFQIMHKEVPPIKQGTVVYEPSDADYHFSAKVCHSLAFDMNIARFIIIIRFHSNQPMLLVVLCATWSACIRFCLCLFISQSFAEIAIFIFVLIVSFSFQTFENFMVIQGTCCIMYQKHE